MHGEVIEGEIIAEPDNNSPLLEISNDGKRKKAEDSKGTEAGK